MALKDRLIQVWKAKDVRNSILFILGILVIYRLGAHIPIPGVNIGDLQAFFNSNQVLGLLNLFSGGALANFSILMLGVGPYITSSIIFQLLNIAIPKLEELQKEGEAGQRKINMYTRLATIPLAAMQGFATILFLQRSAPGVLGVMTPFDWVVAVVTVTAGSVFLMWLGELITEKNIGNGISILIFAGIIAGLPTQLQQSLVTFDASQIPSVLAFIVIGIVTIIGVVYVTEAQRNIPITYARARVGVRDGRSVDSHLPIRVNQAGVIPIIFAISVVLFPPIIAQYFVDAEAAWLATSAQQVVLFFNNQFYYGLIYFVLVFAFSYFYTSVIFHPDRIAENLQRNSGFIPGIRPGPETEKYIKGISTRLLLFGATFLGLIAVLPIAVSAWLGFQNLALGGTSLLIVVAVVIEIVKQVEAQLIVRDYEGFYR